MKHTILTRILAVLLLAALAVGCFAGCGQVLEEYVDAVNVSMNLDRVYVIREGSIMYLTTEAALFRPTMRFLWNKAWRKDITKVVILDDMKPENMEMWFRNMPNLETIEGLEKIDTSHMTHMTHLFLNCEKLKAVEGLSQWDTASVIQMQRMFDGCKSLTELDLSGWDVSRVENMSKMFANSGLAHIRGLEDWNTNKLEKTQGMFEGSAVAEVPAWAN